MNIWAIADLHLAGSVPEKSMECFGPTWKDYVSKMDQAWRQRVEEEDLVLIAGDISWAKSLAQVHVDLEWIAALPGQKVLIKGNHDYWWSSLAKVRAILPPSLHVIQNDAFDFHNISVAGTRLWDTIEYSCASCTQYQSEPLDPKELQEQERIYDRELERLELSLKSLNPQASLKIAMTHYPPLGPDLKSSRASLLLEKYGIHFCLFGHLHNIQPQLNLFGAARGVSYALTSSDYLEFAPLQIISL